MIRPDPFSTATTEGSLSTIPSPFTYTKVLAVPRSTAMSFTGISRLASNHFLNFTIVENPWCDRRLQAAYR